MILLVQLLLVLVKSGTIRRCSFSIFVRRDVFNVLFGDRGSAVNRKPGKMYSRSDFSSEYFCDHDFVYHVNCTESVRVVFPVYMYSFVKTSKLCCNRFDFVETLYIS